MELAPTIFLFLTVVAAFLTELELALAVSTFSHRNVAGSGLTGSGLNWVVMLELGLGAGCRPLFRFSSSFCTLILISSLI